MRKAMLLLSTLAVAAMVSPGIAALVPAGVLPHVGGPYNGFGSYLPGNGYDAPIFREFAVVEGVLTQYHVLSQEIFRVDQHLSHIWQFPACSTLRPVLELHQPHPGDGGFQGPHDAPTRQIVDVVLSTGCTVQPTSEAQVHALAILENPRPMFVNAPVVPHQLENWTDQQLFNAPPYRPRIDAWQAGAPVKFITYETSWSPVWAGTKWGLTQGEADVFIVSYGSIFRPGWTIFNVAVGTPLEATATSYSPVWRANCIVDAVNQKCMVSVNMLVPGYHQCSSVAECTSLVNENTGLQVLRIMPNTFTHIDCPMVAVDVTGDDYIDSFEELVFPNLWVDGPVIA